ncbi:DUF2461 domain-containing protein [Cesiribacter andamanensis]|uniref:TIGR02453 family protein n=1 Tax=Cesiribacter andamanensis AMV16 TaxID=1279009 RepID=M7N3D1_9BACT|nr:DUF2461 domain-containing protein [Cesiribacter andamanensis]EMR01726.1 hypothetical protein ADICEAN_03155 [Cesiribacter andamanensis AMV16]
MFDIPYILDFLAQLAQNNNKEWMDAHRADYQQARQHFKALTGWVIEQLQQSDESLQALRPEDCMFRINRDVRFSADKAPYKIWMSAALAEGGRHAPLSHYYFHLEPNNESLVGGGIYTPTPEQLRKIRQEVDYNAPELKQIVEEPAFKQLYGPIQGEKLQRPPKGYSPEHPNIEFLKLKSFFAMHTYSDAEARAADFPQKLVEGLRVVQPFNEFLNVAVS